MTPDIIKAIADVLDAIEGVRAAETGEDEDGAWEILCDSGDSLGMALGLDPDAPWDDVATALRALARPDVGLPEGWAIGSPTTHPDGVVSLPAFGPDATYIMLHMHDGRATWSRVHAAPPAVYLHLLRAAGVAS